MSRVPEIRWFRSVRRANRPPVGAVVEALEFRAVLSPLGPSLDGDVLVICGDPAADDVIGVSPAGDDIVVNFNGDETSFSNDDVASIRYGDGGGNNQFIVDAALTRPVVVETGPGADSIQTGAGDDHIEAGRGGDTIHAGDGDDTVFGDRGRDLIIGGPGLDRLNGEGANDTIRGGAGDDELFGGGGHDRMFGDDGNDTLEDPLGRNYFEGNAGDDVLQTGFGPASVSTVKGGPGNDRISIFAGRANGGIGDDTLFSRDSTDVTLMGASGADELESAGGRLKGGNGRDTLILAHGSVNGVADGERGNDWVQSVAVKTQTLLGSAGHDTLIGSCCSNDSLVGGDGNDLLRGQGGADTLIGGAGNDRLFGDNGVDVLDGGAGNDLLNGGNGAGTLIGGDGDDTLKGRGASDLLLGGPGDDLLRGDSGRDVLVAGVGVDTIFGEADEDLIVAGSTNLSTSDLVLVQDEWTSERSQIDRAANIRDGSGGNGANGSAFLDSTTVSDDGVPDEVTGGDDLDWFFARLSDDALTDKLEEELFDAI